MGERLGTFESAFRNIQLTRRLNGHGNCLSKRVGVRCGDEWSV